MNDRPRPSPFGPRSIRFRIAAAFFVALLAMVGAQTYLIAQQGPVNASLRLVTEGYLPLAKQVARLRRDQDRVQRDLNRINNDRPRPVTGETSVAEIYTEELRGNLDDTRAMSSAMRLLSTGPEEQAVLTKVGAYLDSIELIFASYQEQSVAYLAMVAAGRLQEAQDNLRRPLRTSGKQLAEEFEKLERTIDGRITALTKATEQQQARATAVAVSLASLAALLGLALLGASFYALRPIGQLTAEVQRIAAGDVGARVEVGGDNEVGVLAAEFNAMAQAIEQRDRSLHERADELNRLSRYLGSVVDSLEDGLLVVEHGVVTLVNPAAARLWDVVVEAAPPEVLRRVLRPGQHELEGPGERLFAVRAVPFGPEGVVAVLTDVTAAVRAQERLARSERLALVGQMLAQITHEVRNPLNALSLNAELLGDELERLDAAHATEGWEILAMIAGEVQRLTDVTGHYLQLARRPPARLRSANVGRVVEEVARLLEPELDEVGAELSLSLDPIPDVMVDDNQLRQALLNVVRNALESGARGLTMQLMAQGEEVFVSLQDDGPGMTEAEISHATDPFFSTKASGTGLGLAITRQILEDHDGRVEITSDVGQGALVRLVFPRRSDDADLPLGDDHAPS